MYKYINRMCIMLNYLVFFNHQKSFFLLISIINHIIKTMYIIILQSNFYRLYFKLCIYLYQLFLFYRYYRIMKRRRIRMEDEYQTEVIYYKIFIYYLYLYVFSVYL